MKQFYLISNLIYFADKLLLFLINVIILYNESTKKTNTFTSLMVAKNTNREGSLVRSTK